MRYFLLALLCSSLTAGDWTKQDTLAEAAVIASLYADWSQTRQIAASPNLHECNPILGKHPSAHKVNQYFIASAVLHAVIAYKLPPKQRRIFQAVTFGVEAGCIANNYSLGVRVKF